MRCPESQKAYRYSSDILLKGREGDILIKNGEIAAIFPSKNSQDKLSDEGPLPYSTAPDTKIIDTGNCLITKGFTDIHVHFREPGFSYKETIRSGSLAAARGGYTTVCTMPNLNPAPDSVENIALQQEIIDRDADIEVLPYACISAGRKGQELVDFAALKPLCCAFSDDGSGVQSEDLMYRAMKTAQQYDCLIAAHCEDDSLLDGGYIHKGQYCLEHNHKGICSESEWTQIERDLALCAKTACRYHICHISCKESVELVRKAKSQGIRVTCETAPHYLILCEEDLQEDGRFKMNPPLRTAEDRAALIEGLRDGTIDVIATDHAPHSAEEKSKGLKGSAMGIVGLETSFALLYTKLVLSGQISMERLLEALCSGAQKVLGLKEKVNVSSPYSLRVGDKANIAIIDLDQSYIIDSKQFVSKGHSTPFDGQRVRGKVKMTIYNGEIVWTDGSLG